MQAPLALQIGHSPAQSALLVQGPQVFFDGSQRGVVCGHWELRTQATHSPLVKLQTSRPGDVQSAFRVHSTQIPRLSQIGVSPGQPMPFRHVSRQWPAESHVLPVGQSVALVAGRHCTHWLTVRSQRGAGIVQSASPRHQTHVCDPISQRNGERQSESDTQDAGTPPSIGLLPPFAADGAPPLEAAEERPPSSE